MSRSIAVVEDEAPIRENYLDAFRRHGFVAHGYPDRASAERAFAAELPDLVIIDIGLGDEHEGGFELCRALRARSQRLPIIFLTARDSELDAVSGLRLGADDYLTKDISIPHLMARVSALLRRLEALARPGARTGSDQNGDMQRGELSIDTDCLTVRWRGRPVDLTVTEFWIVHALARYPGHVRSREQLMEAASLVVDESTITSHIKRIRHKFQQHDPEFDCLRTVHGAGYRWAGAE